MHINPDHFLQTENGRVITPERNRQAWQWCYQALESALQQHGAQARLYLMIGAQGSGKSHWAKQLVLGDTLTIVFDAILVKQSERAPLLETAAKYGVETIAVWMQTPLATCLARNAQRHYDEVVAEQALRNVYAAIEPPLPQEGWHSILYIHAEK